MSIDIFQDGIIFKINVIWLKWYITKFLRSKKTIREFTDSASDSDIQKLINMAIEDDKIYCCQ